ncbi:MAG: strawberry notch family protein, partial [Bacteroidia bacterium]|nr:strawberry notch family protein [Bacteroidia bacterium]
MKKKNIKINNSNKKRRRKSGLSGPYDPVAVSCFSLKVNVPDSMDTEVRKSQETLYALGDIVEFVRRELNYKTKDALCDALAAEQIDAVAMAILKAKKGQAMIIGDQTGIGKGRQAAAMIRWAVENNRDFPEFTPPVFITEKQNLFSDLYRDLLAIGCANYKPFIVNNDSKIKDEEKKVIFKNTPDHQKQVWEYYMAYSGDNAPRDTSPIVRLGYDFVVATYSQFMQKKAVEKRTFLEKHCKVNGIMILDEAHNVSGKSDTGAWFQSVVGSCQAAIFLSATYAKRPDNMALYATKTSLKEIGANPEEFTSILQKGGTALQEVIASKLAENGEMVRRERPYEDVEVNYLILNEKSDEHRAKCDAITALVRDIIAFEDNFVMQRIGEIDDELAKYQEQTSNDNKSAGVGKTPMFSKIFQTIYQMLMAIKVDDVVDRAIARLKSGHKVVIAFGNTMESFLNEFATGDQVDNDFAEILRRALEGTLRYTVRGASAKDTRVETLSLAELGPAAIAEYNNILQKIKTVSSGVTISPIDIMIQKLEDAGYVVDEVTGRKRRLEFNQTWSKGTVIPRKQRKKEDQFFDFQNNNTDVLLINQSGATGASAHAIPTKQVAKDRVRPRCMIVLQPELDINKEIQKRGRINRTGQIYPPK